jgi:formate hydrogenlyase subunit 4
LNWPPVSTQVRTGYMLEYKGEYETIMDYSQGLIEGSWTG